MSNVSKPSSEILEHNEAWYVLLKIAMIFGYWKEITAAF